MGIDHRAEWLRGVEEGYISRDSKITWSTEIDGLECETCRGLADSQVGLLDAFRWGDPPIHEGCRCTLNLVPEEVDPDLVAMSDDELEAEINKLLSKRRSWPARLSELLRMRKGN